MSQTGFLENEMFKYVTKVRGEGKKEAVFGIAGYELEIGEFEKEKLEELLDSKVTFGYGLRTVESYDSDNVFQVLAVFN